ncbi:MAG: hypothetical protein KA712_01100 [Myxococcales bacterium]|nr:hypothetical protein [Myxococcales bacterium]
MKHTNADHAAGAEKVSPPMRLGQWLRAGAVLGTFWLLLAESPPPICGDGLGPQTFFVTGDCGPSGLVVLSVDQNDRLTIDNASRLGFFDEEPSGWLSNSNCPPSMAEATLELWGEARGHLASPVADAGTDARLSPEEAASDASAGMDAGASLPSLTRYRQRCSVRPEGGALVASCTPEGAGRTCRSTLKPWAGQP